MKEVYQLFKKRGFWETLTILGAFKDGEAVQKEFFREFETRDSYYNAFLRVKDYLIEHDLISFKCKRDGTKVIYLTDKGYFVLGKLKDIEDVIEKEKPINEIEEE